LITSAFGDLAFFGVAPHTPLGEGIVCAMPSSPTVIDPVTFAFDAARNGFVLFGSGNDTEFGGAGFAAIDLGTTSSSGCDSGMSTRELIPVGIPAAHSMAWDPFLSNLGADPPHSDFVLMGDSQIAHVRVLNPGTASASASVISSVTFSDLGVGEFDQGAPDALGHVFVADASSGNVGFLDYSRNTNGTIDDPNNSVRLTSFLDADLDDVGPLVGQGSPPPTPTPLSDPFALQVFGRCRQPGTNGLIACIPGTTVTVYRCDNLACTALSPLGTGTVDDLGQFVVVVDSREAAGARLLVEASIVDPVTAGARGAGRGAEGTAYRFIAFGPAGTGGRVDTVVDPAAEAATRLIEQSGAQNFTDDGIDQVTQAVRGALAGNTFAGQSAETAASLATGTAQGDAGVQTALQDTRPPCLGDCNDDRSVTINEIVTLVNITLGTTSIAACTAGNGSADAAVTVDEILRALNNALGSCPG
jgi:hypothetical protein